LEAQLGAQSQQLGEVPQDPEQLAELLKQSRALRYARLLEQAKALGYVEPCFANMGMKVMQVRAFLRAHGVALPIIDPYRRRPGKTASDRVVRRAMQDAMTNAFQSAFELRARQLAQNDGWLDVARHYVETDVEDRKPGEPPPTLEDYLRARKKDEGREP
jgi:hypothetical protein